MQVAEEERKLQLDNMFKDVAGVLVEKCVNPESSRPYTLALIERALRDVHFNVDLKKSAKQQALEVRVCMPPRLHSVASLLVMQPGLATSAGTNQAQLLCTA